ncbi:MAG TPA: hypothetical protein VFU05_09615 [Cyclobacteriaceae bacterium]|nr:hypothetical protein [Cyclobacteriaceae bacterium]
MRLGQLARKLSLRPAQIVEFLSQHNIQIEDNSNSRIESDHTELVVNHFAPGTLPHLVELADEPEEITPDETERPQAEVAAQPETIEQPTNPESEVIRVQKIELSGLKVLGKIELPEPKKKEPMAEKSEEGAEASTVIQLPTPDRKSRNQKRPGNPKRDRPREWRNPIEMQREREAREAEEKRRKEVEREKERRKRHYEEKRKAVVQTKRTKAVKEQPAAPKKPIDTRPVPKTWLGKFLRWWTT